MRDIFLGPFRFWALWIAVLFVLYIAGREQMHVTSFNWFLALLAGLAAVSVLGIILTTRKDERITREPIDES